MKTDENKGKQQEKFKKMKVKVECKKSTFSFHGQLNKLAKCTYKDNLNC